MNVNLGDSVRFLNDVGEGIVTKIVSKTIVNVRDNNGFDIPSHVNELVVVKKANSQDKDALFVSKTIVSNPEPEETESEVEYVEGNDKPAVFLGITKDAKTLHFHLINDCNYHLFYNFSLATINGFEQVMQGTLAPNSKEKVWQIAFEKISETEGINLQYLYFRKGSFDLLPQGSTLYKLNHVSLYKDGVFEENDFFEENALIADLTENFTKKIDESIAGSNFDLVKKEKELSEKYSKEIAERAKPKPEPITWEVDLHINNLLIDCRGMSNGEILEYQMKEFHKKFTEALQSGVAKLVFIHGIGNGTLKAKVRETLEKEYKKFKFQDASYKEYGFGATLVYLK